MAQRDGGEERDAATAQRDGGEERGDGPAERSTAGPAEATRAPAPEAVEPPDPMPWEWLVPIALGVLVAAQQLLRSAYAERPSALGISISTAFIAVLLPVFVLDVAGRLRRRRRVRRAGPPGPSADPGPSL